MRVALSVAPCEKLEADEALLGSVMVLLQHMYLPLDGMLPEGGPPLPARLLGAARLCSLRAADDLTRLAVARADERPLSPTNERRDARPR